MKRVPESEHNKNATRPKESSFQWKGKKGTASIQETAKETARRIR
jgi:hypothetical protein